MYDLLCGTRVVPSPTEARLFWMFYPVLCELWDFPFLLVGTGTIPGSLWMSIMSPCHPLREERVVLSLSLGCFPHPHALFSTQLNMQGWPADLWSSPSMPLCPPKVCPVNFGHLLLLDSQLCLLNSWASWSPPSCDVPWGLSQGSKLRWLQGSHHLLPISWQSLSFMTDVQCPENQHIVYFHKKYDVLWPGLRSYTSSCPQNPAG